MEDIKPSSMFGRITDKFVKETETLDQLIDKINTTIDGEKIARIRDPEDFKRKIEYYKVFLEATLPDYTLEEILKFERNYRKLQEIFWVGYEELMIAIEFELRKKNESAN